MIFVCDVCSTSLQIDEKKAPNSNFSVRCPKCKNLVRVNLESAESNNKQTAVSNSGESKNWELPPQTAPAFKISQKEKTNADNKEASALPENALSMLANLLLQKQPDKSQPFGEQSQRILICLPAEHREMAGRILSEAGWEAFVADSSSQAIETLSDMRVENVIFSSAFAQGNQGASALQRYFSQLTGAERRRLFVVSLENTIPTYNTHEAFQRNLNLIVNVRDLPNLPLVLKRARRDFDEAYRHFKFALAAS